MIVSSGFFDDVRVRKMALYFSTLASEERSITVLAANRQGQAPNADHGVSDSIDVRLHGKPTTQFASTWRKIWGRVRFSAWVVFTLRRNANRTEILHFHDLDTAVLGMVSRKRGQPFIVDMHEVYSGRQSVNSVLKWVYAALEKLVLPKADGTVFVSGSARDYYLSRMALRNPIVVTNSRPTSEIAAPDSTSPNDSVTRLVYVGRYSRGRGLEQLVRSLEYLPVDAYTLHLIGFGPLEGDLRRIASELQDPSRVEFRDPVPISDVVETVRDFSIGVVLTELSCLNHQLTVSNKLFEYAAAGLPMVLSRAEEHKVLDSEYGLGVLTDTDSASIASAVRSLSEDQPTLQRARLGVRRLARNRAWECEVSQLEQLYRECSI